MRRRKQTFIDPKMLSSRVERSDYNKLEELLIKDRLNVQDFLNTAVRSYISGSVVMSGSALVGGGSGVL